MGKEHNFIWSIISNGVSLTPQVLYRDCWLPATFPDQYGTTSHIKNTFMQICLIEVRKKDKDIYVTNILILLILRCLRNSKVQLSKSKKVFAYFLHISICETTKALTEKEIKSCFILKTSSTAKAYQCAYAIHCSSLKRLGVFLNCTLFCLPIKAI